MIEQELPCFGIEVKRGQLILVVSHYLAKIILPSGLTLEILPKISLEAASDSYKGGRQLKTTLPKALDETARQICSGSSMGGRDARGH